MFGLSKCFAGVFAHNKKFETIEMAPKKQSVDTDYSKELTQ